MFSKLQYISQGANAREQLNNIQSALDAGCKWVQLRYKKAAVRDIKKLAEEVKRICDGYSAILIINDHPFIAKEISADGVHLGLKDMPVARAKDILGGKIIGGTANTLADTMLRMEEGCSYIGIGPFRFTATKEKLSPVLGLEGYKRILDPLREKKIRMPPLYAIGGIMPEDIAPLMQAGVYGAAVSGAITHHPDKRSLLQQFNSLLYATVNDHG